MLPIHRLISVSRSICVSDVLGASATNHDHALRIRGAAVDVTHQGSVQQANVTWIPPTRGRGGNKR